MVPTGTIAATLRRSPFRCPAVGLRRVVLGVPQRSTIAPDPAFTFNQTLVNGPASPFRSRCLDGTRTLEITRCSAHANPIDLTGGP